MFATRPWRCIGGRCNKKATADLLVKEAAANGKIKRRGIKIRKG